LANSALEDGRTLVYATILFWQTRELAFLGRCIDSLLAQDVGDSIEFRIILIDNGCGAEPGLPADPSIELIRLPENRGFAGGHNVGIRRAMECGADYVLLFNSDAVAQAGLVRELVAVARAWPSAVFVGPLIVRAAAPEWVESAGQSFNTRTARHRELGRGVPVATMDDNPHPVDAVSGCALLARCRAVDAVGLLDDELFMYFEDMDWCLRARRYGYDVVVAPAARVQHMGEGSTGGASPRSTFFSVRNHMVVAARQTGQIRGWLVMLLALSYQLAFLAHSRARRNRMHLDALVQGARAAWSGHLGPWQSGANRH
jgi:GT2 family glycosyltransferase